MLWDRQTEALYGLEPGTFDGTLESYLGYIHDEDVADVLSLIQEVAARGGLYSVRHRVVWPDGTVRWIEGQGRIDTAPDGAPSQGYGIAYDVTDRATFERERSELERREAAAVEASHASRNALEILIRAGDALAGSLNTARVTERLANVLTEQFADFCVIDVRLDEPHGWLLTCVRNARTGDTVRHAAGPATMAHAATRLEAADQVPLPALQAPIAVDTDRLAAAIPPGNPHLLVEPLVSRGSTIGSVIVGRSSRGWEAEATHTLRAIGRRAAVALDHAELYRDRSAIARMFQLSMSPGELPEIPGLDVGVLYRPATELVRLGGDLYDVFATANDGWMLAVGDVCGKGAVAAGHAGLARAALRAAAHATSSTADALAVLNSTLISEPSRPLLTMGLASVRPNDDPTAWTLTAASAGHPQALLMRKGAEIAPLSTKGTLLGYVPDPVFTTVRTVLGPGDVVVLYSDGVIEARRGRQLFGVDRLVDALRIVADAPAGSITDAVGATIDAWTAESPTDDMVLLVARVGRAG